MAVDGSLIFDTQINTKGFQIGRKNIMNSLDGIKSSVLKLGAAIGAAFGVKQLVNFGKTAVESAAEVKAANSQLEQTFGSLQTSAEAAIQRISDSSGIVKTRLQGVGTSIYAFAKTTGMDSAQALGMMEEALKVAADSAAYYDRSLEETSESLKSFLKGNYENDAALGLSCTETTRNTAANKLYGKSFQELSESQKQLVLLQMVKDANALSGAMGQAAREADGWENVIGNLKETWKQFAAVLGQPILAAATSAVKQLTASLATLTEYARSAVNALSKVFGWEQSQAVQTSSVNSEISDSVENQNALTEAVENTVKANKKMLAGFDEVNTISGENATETQPSYSVNSNQIQPVSAEVTADTDPLENAITASLERIKAQLDKLIEPVKIAWDINKNELISSAKSAFEEVKELAKSMGQSFSDVWTNGTGEQYVSNILVILSDVFSIIRDISNALTTAWNDNGTGETLIQSYFDRWNALLELIHRVSDDFREVWNNGTGETFFSNILQIVTNINETVANLRERFALAWSENDTGKGIIQVILDIFNIILETVNNITESTSEWAENLDFSPLLESIKGLLESLEPLSENIGSGLEWFYNNVLLPLASWTIEDAAPAFIDLLSAAIDTANSIIKTFKPLGKWLWDKFLKPVASWTGGVIVTVIENIAKALKGISDWISQHQTLVEDFIIVVGTLGAALGIASIIQTVIAAFTAMGGVMGILTGITTGLTAVTTALSGAFAFLTSPITLIVLAIGAVIAIGVLLVKHWDEVKAFAIGMWESIKETMYAFYDWVVEKFNALTDFLSGIWESIKAIFSVVSTWFKGVFEKAWNNIKSAWSNVKNWFSDLWNSIKSIFSNVGNWFKEKFQSAWDNITSIFSGIGNWFSNRWSDIKNIFSGIGTWFSEKFQSAWNNITAVFSGAGEWFGGIWDGIKGAFGKVTSWFRDTFSEAWQAVKNVFCTGGEVFSGITDGILETFKEVVNMLIDGINTVITIPFDGINWALEKISGIEIGGFTPFDWISPIDIPQIPHLAKGTVVPANYGEFLAVLGDNKKEREFVAPESALKNALIEAMSQINPAQGDIVINVSMFPNERAFERYVVKAVRNVQSRGGKIS